ncbi:lasso peptide biosynthesis B2 protein [Streptomyces sp. 5K101]|uniref:lasso peptide biosynthesis B2 protein n=1 Tax=Streptomyces sp. 5K101 TaxID=3390037 RepID=UPI003975852D
MTHTTGLYCAITAHGTALLDTRHGRGQWRFLDPISTELWQRIVAGTPTADAIDTLTRSWAARGADSQTVRTDLTRVADDLTKRRLLTPAAVADPSPRPARVRVARHQPSTFPARLAAHTGLALALTLLRCLPLRLTLTLARTARRMPGRPASLTRAEALHAAVRQAARGWPGRAACLEESLATLLAGALTGQRMHFVLGATFLPHGAHAWNEADGHIIGQAPEDEVWPYEAVLKI